MSTMRELIAAVETAKSTGSPLPVVEFTKRIDDMESYLDHGMKARVVNVVFEDAFPDDEGGDLYKVFFNFAEFDDYNASFEQANWYDKNGDPVLTAAQAGCKPSDGLESVYMMEYPDKYGDYFNIVADDHSVLVRFPDQESYDVVVQALFFHKSMLEMRIEEAMSGALSGDTKARDDAQRELDALLRAEKAMGIDS